MASASRLPQTALVVEFGRALTAVDEATAGAAIEAADRQAAHARAQALFEACGAGRDTVALVQLVYAAELLALIAVDLAAAPGRARSLLTALERQAGVAPVALGRELLSTGHLLELPAAMAIEVRLGLLLAFLGATSVGLWMTSDGDELTALSHAGALDADLAAQRRDAARVLDLEPAGPGALEPEGVAARIERLTPPAAAIVAVGGSVPDGHARLLVSAAAPVLAALLDRDALPARQHATAQTVAGAVERRLARLRFDLHDGPQQDVHLLAQDLALFRDQLRPSLAQDPNAERLMGRLDDLKAQLVALDGDLRRLSSAVQSPFLVPGSLAEALRELAERFASRTEIEPEIMISGGLSHLTDSQQITLLALVREALSNIRKHARARAIQIAVSADDRGAHVEIRDDGDGFDPEAMLVRAARAGRLGLVGMHERVRMLGGRTHIDSRPGGPTVISATLPPWPPAES
ncbi:MAG TPA: ATP-binding protein [Solirubrobacteraceae bacterium]|nr:ATP-binding protein [Solirubrobacteraceae bacterium]